MNYKTGILSFLAFLSLGFFSYAAFTTFARPISIVSPEFNNALSLVVLKTTVPEQTRVHIAPPAAVKGIYMTSFVAGNKALREKLVDIATTTEINAIVIDIKDYSGTISFVPNDPLVRSVGAYRNRIPDIRAFIDELHEKGIYVIGRITAFQDPLLVAHDPTLAVQRQSTPDVWRDFKGIAWLDAGAKDVWDYLVALGRESYDVGFDELNFDYVRFPSDGNMKDIRYVHSFGQKKPEVLKNFFAYLSSELRPTGVVLSADLFGMTTTNKDDLNIGQILENALPYFDYIDPMVYPSHYPKNFMGFQNPAAKPYEVVKYSMDHAVARASTTPQKIRPWLQDFNLGATYTPAMVRAQIQATYDAGLEGWLLWNASNRYTKAALLPEDVEGDFSTPPVVGQ